MVSVLQADNRVDLDYVILNREANSLICKQLNYSYHFEVLDMSKYPNMAHPICKIYIVYNFLMKSTDDILIFLDTDAWIQNKEWLKQMLDSLTNCEHKHGCFSRDPYLNFNTFINSGSFILKINDFTRSIYKQIIMNFESGVNSHAHKWPYDQYYISNAVYKHRDNFFIFIPNCLNTPLGSVLRHNWQKNEKMYEDLRQLNGMTSSLVYTKFYMDAYLDRASYPNKDTEGYQYFSY